MTTTATKRWYQRPQEEEDESNLFGNLTPKGDSEDIDEALIKMSKKLMKYRLNVFLLQRAALRIQHWYFVTRHTRKQVLKKAHTTKDFVKPQSRIPKLAAALALEKQKSLNTKSVMTKVPSVTTIAGKENKRNEPNIHASPITQKSPQVTLQAKPIVEKSAQRNIEQQPVSKLSTMKKSASLANHHQKINNNNTVTSVGRASVRQPVSTPVEAPSIVIKSKVFEVKRNSLYERPSSSKITENTSTLVKAQQLNADLKKVVDKKQDVRSSVTKLPTGTSISKSSRNSVKLVSATEAQSAYQTTSTFNSVQSTDKLDSIKGILGSFAKPSVLKNTLHPQPAISSKDSKSYFNHHPPTSQTPDLSISLNRSSHATSNFIVSQDPTISHSMIEDAWRKAEEIKKEKQQRRLKLSNSGASSARKRSDKENEVGNNCNDELQAIIDSAWVQTRETVFRKKRNSVVSSGKNSARGNGDLPSARNVELEEIDEKEESFKMTVDNVDPSPLKELKMMGLNGQMNESMLSSMNKETLKQHIMQANFFTQRQDTMEDCYSTNMNSQNGSPFRKARRTREERRKNGITRNFGEQRCDLNESTIEHLNESSQDCNDSMINISPLKKSSKLNIQIPLLKLQTPARINPSIEDDLMSQNLEYLAMTEARASNQHRILQDDKECCLKNE